MIKILSLARTLALASIVLAAGAGTALARGNSVHVSVPRVTAGTPYNITVHGFAVGSKHLYLFADTRACGANPAVEFARTGTTGTASGYYISSVSGSFTKLGGFSTGSRIKDHACAYLTSSSQPKNSPNGVVAHAFKTFKVH